MRGRSWLSVAIALVLLPSTLGGLILSTAQPASAQTYVGSTVQPLPFGDASTGGQVSLSAQAEFVGMAAMPDSKGYWLTGADGGVFALWRRRLLRLGGCTQAQPTGRRG